MKLAPHDLHVVVDATNEHLKVFNPEGVLQWTAEARCFGSNGPGWDRKDGDTPPGEYEIGPVDPIPESDPERDAYGPYFLTLLDIHGDEAKYHRAGVGIHGGGTGLPGAFTAPHQGWEVTHGCIRLQNSDLRKLVMSTTIVHANGGRVFVTVQWGG